MSDVLLLVECLQGTGELTQARQLAKALLKKGKTVTVATSSGIDYFKDLQGETLELVELPALTFDAQTHEYEVDNKSTGKKSPLFSANGGVSDPGKKTIATRTNMILDALARTKGNVLCASGWPFWLGEQILDTEMKAVLGEARRTDKHVTLVTRDIINADSPMVEGGHEAICKSFEENEKLHWVVLGDETIQSIPLKFLEACGIVNERLHYVGFGETPHPAAKLSPLPSDNIIVAPGGGDFRLSSYNILRTAIAASVQFPHKEWTLITGKKYPDEKLKELKNAASIARAQGANITILQQMPHHEFQQHLLNTHPLFIGQCGIGSTNDIIKYKLRSLLIPIDLQVKYRDHNNNEQTMRFDEQLVRAHALDEHGLITMLDPNKTSTPMNQEWNEVPAAFTQALVDRIHAAEKMTPAFDKIKTGGYENAALFANPGAATLISYKKPLRSPD